MKSKNQIVEAVPQLSPKKLKDEMLLCGLFNALAECYANYMKMRRNPSQPFTGKKVKPPAFIENARSVVHVENEGPHPISEAHVDYHFHCDNLPKTP